MSIRCLLITSMYPSPDNVYQGMFIHSRLIQYKKMGLSADVFKCSMDDTVGVTEYDGIKVYGGHFKHLNDFLSKHDYQTVLIHFFSEAIWSNIKHHVLGRKIIVWVHGVEVQGWWRRKHNFLTTQQVEQAKVYWARRKKFWREIFELACSNQYNFHFVFVSKYLAESAFEDIRVMPPLHKFSIIHNYIDGELFSYEQKEDSQRKKILSIRPFSNLNYANDLTVKALLALSNDPIFHELQIHIIGRGELFATTLEPLREFKNVTIEERFMQREEISNLHKEYGVFLVPTRMDSQGVSRDEAMASGLVPITNRVAAIPEFVDQDCGLIAEPEDYHGLAQNIKKLYDDPSLFQRLSRNAAERVRRQSGFENTILREMNLIQG